MFSRRILLSIAVACVVGGSAGTWFGGKAALERTGQAQAAIALSWAIERHHRDVRLAPQSLHWLAYSAENVDAASASASGVEIQRFYAVPWEDVHSMYWEVLFRTAEVYNRITIGQACYLALNGEASDRVGTVFRLAQDAHADREDSGYLAALAALQRGDPKGREFFSRHLSYAIGSGGLTEQYWEEVLLPNARLWGPREETVPP